MHADNRLQSLNGRKGLLAVYLTAGYPHLDDTVGLCETLQEAGVDLIELGMPFSDPVADGPTIQLANQRALGNGMTTRRLLEQVRQIRQSVTVPILLMGYLNPVLQYGMDRFLEEAWESGVDGLILPDLPLDLYEAEWRSNPSAQKLAHVFLVTPQTPDERVKRLDAASSGFLYAVSSSSITGGTVSRNGHLAAYLARLRSLNLENPLMVGFGITNGEQFREVCKHADGAIVGSALLRALQEGEGSVQDNARNFVRSVLDS